MIKLESYLEKPYIKFILWFLTGLSVVLFGIINAKALENDNNIYFYNNNGTSVNEVSTSFISEISRSEAILTTYPNSYGGLAIIQLQNPLIANHIYSLFLNVAAESLGGQTRISSKNCLGVGDSVVNAANRYVSNCITPKFSDYAGNTGDKTRGVYYTFIAPQNAIYLAVPYTTQFNCSNCMNYSYGYTLSDGGDTTGLTQDQLNSVIVNQTNNLQNSINNVEENINNTINDNFNTCEEQETLTFNTINGYELDANGNTIESSSWLVTDYIPVKPKHSYYINGFSSYFICYYDSSKKLISTTRTQNYTASDNTYYIRLNSLISSYNGSIIQNEYCVNKIDSTNDKLDQTNDQLGNLNDNLTDSDIDNNNVSSSFEDFNSFLDDNSTITQLITLPITLYTAILNNVNGTCTPFNLGNLYGVNLSLPCVNIGNYLGSFLWGMIDIIISGFAVYYIAKKLVKIFNNVSSMKEGDVIDD